MEEPTDNNADQGDWFIAPTKPESGKRSKTRTRLEYVGKSSGL